MRHVEPKDKLGYTLQPATLPPLEKNARHVIFLPGVDGHGKNESDDGARIVAGMMRTVMFNACPALNDVHCSAVVYHNQNTLSHAMDLKHYYDQPGSHVSADAKQFTHEVLFPLLGLDKEKKPSAEVIGQRLSRVTFVGHSYGAIFAQEVANELHHTLAERNYALKEITSIVHHGVVISTAGPDIKNTKAPQFVTLRFRATNDKTIDNILGGLEKVSGVFSAFNHVLKATGYDEKVEFDVKSNPDAALVRARLPDKLTYKRPTGETAVIDEHSKKLPGLFVGGHMDKHHLVKMHWCPDIGSNPSLTHKKYIDIKQDALERAVHRGPQVANATTLLGPRAKGEGMHKLLATAPAKSYVDAANDRGSATSAAIV